MKERKGVVVETMKKKTKGEEIGIANKDCLTPSKAHDILNGKTIMFDVKREALYFLVTTIKQEKDIKLTSIGTKKL
jgi:hypothetical protein